MRRRGIVWISPAALAVPSGGMVDPDSSLFVVSWQDSGPLEHTQISGAEAAIAWGRKRSERVVIRLGHDGPDTYFSAGDREDDEFPRWPPPRRARPDWWSPSNAGNERSLSGRWSVQLGLKLQGAHRLSEASADTFAQHIAADGAVHGIIDIERPTPASIRLTAIVAAEARIEAEARSQAILDAARSAVGNDLHDWSTTGTWSSVNVHGPAPE
jgi:hypothetical protein